LKQRISHSKTAQEKEADWVIYVPNQAPKTVSAAPFESPKNKEEETSKQLLIGDLQVAESLDKTERKIYSQPDTTIVDQLTHTEYQNSAKKQKPVKVPDESDNETYQKLQHMYEKTRKKLKKYSNVNQLIAEYEGLLKQKKRLEKELERQGKSKSGLGIRQMTTEPRIKRQSSRNK
jgi:hypothetical protein